MTHQHQRHYHICHMCWTIWSNTWNFEEVIALKNKQPNLYFYHHLHLCLTLPRPKPTLCCDEISPFQDRFNDFQSSLSDSVNLSLPPLFCTLLISQYLLIYLLLCKPLVLSLCLAQLACLMRYTYKSIFLFAIFHSAVSFRYFIIPRSRLLRRDGSDQ